MSSHMTGSGRAICSVKFSSDPLSLDDFSSPNFAFGEFSVFSSAVSCSVSCCRRISVCCRVFSNSRAIFGFCAKSKTFDLAFRCCFCSSTFFFSSAAIFFCARVISFSDMLWSSSRLRLPGRETKL